MEGLKKVIFISLDSDPPKSVKSLNLYLSEIKRDRVIERYIERELEKIQLIGDEAK